MIGLAKGGDCMSVGPDDVADELEAAKLFLLKKISSGELNMNGIDYAARAYRALDGGPQPSVSYGSK
jgi:hypothetical protein